MPNDPDKFDDLNGINKSDNKDDFVDSSFAVQFKPGDKTESVADKLKETKENIDRKADSFNKGFKDEFDDFEFDSSISAFKPFKAPETPAEPEKEVKPVSSEPAFPKNGGTFDMPEPSAKAQEPVKANEPKFNDLEDEINKFEFKPDNDKIFKSGSDLDFATSDHDKSTSPFMNAAKPDIPKPDGVDIPRAEKPAEQVSAFSQKPAEQPKPAAPVSPFTINNSAKTDSTGKQKPVAPSARPQAQPIGYRPYPSATQGDVFNAQKQDEAKAMEPAKPTTPFTPKTEVSAKPVEPAKPTTPFSPKPAEPARPTTPFTPKTEDTAKPASPFTSKSEDTVKPLEPAKPTSPFTPKPAEPSKPTTPFTPKADDTAKPSEPAKPSSPFTPKAAEPAKPSEQVKPVIPVAPAKPFEAAKPVAPVNPAAAVIPAKPAAKPVETVKAPAEQERPVRPAATAVPSKPKEAPAVAKAAEQSKFTPPATAKAESVKSAPQETLRPGRSNVKPVAAAPAPAPAPGPSNSPFEPKSRQPVQATRGVMNQSITDTQTSSHHDKTITPVSTVKKSKRRSKERKAPKDPGLAGLITFLAIIVLAIGILWALDNTSGLRSLFGRKQIETIATEASKITTVTTTEDTTATTTTEATTTTTEATTTTTEATTTTTEATTTTTEATTTTTEATTTTTKATTETTKQTKPSTGNTAEGSSINDFDMKIGNFATTAGGFKFDISLKNKSNSTANLPKSLKGLDIKFYCSATITDVTSDAMVFTGDGTSYRGVPNEIAVKGGETYTYTVYVSTSESVSSYGYNYAYFDWVK